jgi:RES domain-containing protein
LIQAWRLVRSIHLDSAMTGEGSRLFGGRWNSPGVPVVYSSEHRSLALLETVVHIRRNTPAPDVGRDYFFLPIQFDESLVEYLPVTSLPIDWRVEPPSPTTQSMGDSWVAEARAPILSVPSVLLPEEINYLFNPGHSMFSRLTVGDPIPCSLDMRLL